MSAEAFRLSPKDYNPWIVHYLKSAGVRTMEDFKALKKSPESDYSHGSGTVYRLTPKLVTVDGEDRVRVRVACVSDKGEWPVEIELRDIRISK